MTDHQPQLREPGVRVHFVYRLLADDGSLLYVGCSRRPVERWRDLRGTHRKLAAQVSRIRMVGPYDFATARALERAAIIDGHPVYNQVHNPGAIRTDYQPRDWAAA